MNESGVSKNLDVLIVGGGMVGTSLAIALEGSGLRVGLAEAVAPRVELQPSYDERNLVLARATLNALEALGILDAAAPAAPIRRIHVNRRGECGAVRMDAAELSLPPFGAVLPARELGNALLRRVDRCADLVRIAPAKAVAIASRDDGVDIELRGADGSHHVHAHLLVGADGTQSFVRDAFGIGTQRRDYAQCAFITTLTTEKPLDGTAWECFTDSGPVALLPMGERRAGFVLCTAAADAARVAALDDAAFIALAHERFGWRAGRFSRPGARKPYPLARLLAERTIAPRTVLVGNAAQTIHPVGAQGFNLGLRDALTLAELLREAARTGADPGARTLLERHVRLRAPDRAATISFSDDLVRGMSNPAPPLPALRTLGFLVLDRIAPLKRRFALRGMGFRGHVPGLSLSR